MDEFESYRFEEDDGWLLVARQIEISADVDTPTRERMLRKRKLKYYKDKVNPGFDSSEESSNGHSASASQDEQENTSHPQNEGESEAEPSVQQPSSGPLLSAALLHRMYFGLHGLVLLSGLFTLIPFSASSKSTAWMLSSLSSCAIYGLCIYQNVPRVEMTTAFAQKLLMDENSHFLLYSLLYSFSAPSLLSIAPNFLRSLLCFSYFANTLLPQYAPGVHAKLTQYFGMVLQRQAEIMNLNSTIEVYQGIALLFGLLFPTRQIMLFMMHWQYLRIRYSLSTHSRLAFSQVRMKVDSLANHPRCPGVVRTVWQKITGLLYSFVNPAQANQQQSRGCSIM